MGDRGTAAQPLGVAPVFDDARGRVTLLPLDQAPFDVKRAYVLSDIPLRGRRAGHANRTQHRLLVAVSGHARVALDDGEQSEELGLRAGDMVHIPPGVWHEIEAVAEPVTIVVLADGDYDPGDRVDDRSGLPLTGPTASHTADA